MRGQPLHFCPSGQFPSFSAPTKISCDRHANRHAAQPAATRCRSLPLTHYRPARSGGRPPASRGVNISPGLSSFRIHPVRPGVNPPSFPTFQPLGPSNVPTLLFAKACRLFAFFCELPPFIFGRLRPLFRKHPGWGSSRYERPCRRGCFENQELTTTCPETRSERFLRGVDC